MSMLGGTGQLISRLTSDEIDIAMYASIFPVTLYLDLLSSYIS